MHYAQASSQVTAIHAPEMTQLHPSVTQVGYDPTGGQILTVLSNVSEGVWPSSAGCLLLVR
ncbi:MAG: hypothetical protein FWD83_03775 [Promicromonosporaceae bacterium]|nr:hypothetical protein [Promicromonosporaceae bacterium]